MPSTWTTTTVYSAGVIVQGLTVSEIETLNLDLDAISKLGEYDGWTDAQVNIRTKNKCFWSDLLY